MYFLARIVCLIYSKLFIRGRYIGLDNIPSNGAFIIASNHISMLDPVILISLVKSRIHFLAKKEIFKFPQGIIFSNLELIAVNRNSNDKEALKSAIDYLNGGHVIGIFPEGTRERGRGLLNFKYGAVKMAKETNTPILPVAIKGKYNMFKKELYIIFGKPFYVKDVLNIENTKLRNTIKSMIDSV